MKILKRGKNGGWEEREEKKLGRERKIEDGRRGMNEGWEEREE